MGREACSTTNRQEEIGKMPEVFIISGVSGSGKSTISDMLLERHTDLDRAITVTSRVPRPGELFGYHYFFVDQERFQWLLETDQLLEHTTVYTNDRYGTLKYAVEHIQKQGKHVLFVIDIKGVEQITEHIPNAKVIFLTAPDEEEQRTRLIRRGTLGDDLNARVAKAQSELERAKEMNIRIVVNDEVTRALEEIERIFFA